MLCLSRTAYPLRGMCCNYLATLAPKEAKPSKPLDKLLLIPPEEAQATAFPVSFQLYATNEYKQNLQFYPVSNSEHKPENVIRVVSYNILAESLALRHQKLYDHLMPSNLTWETRMKQLLPQLETLQSDFYCLQEVDNFARLEKDLSYLGYQGNFKKRTSTNNQDGCAVFWRADRFTQIDTKGIEFNGGKPTEEYDNVALCSFFQKNDQQKQIICLISTHLLFNPQRGDLKLGQAQYMLTQAQKNIKQVKEMFPEASISMVLAGDMNSTPYSGIWELFKRGKLSLDFDDIQTWRKMISGQQIAERRDQQNFDVHECIESLSNINTFCIDDGKLCFQHNFELCSAYENYNILHQQLYNQSIESPPSPLFHDDTYGEPRVTSMIAGSTNAVDSIWFTKNSLELLKLLELPQQNQLDASTTALPSTQHPSDHFILGADLLLKD